MGKKIKRGRGPKLRVRLVRLTCFVCHDTWPHVIPKDEDIYGDLACPTCHRPTARFVAPLGVYIATCSTESCGASCSNPMTTEEAAQGAPRCGLCGSMTTMKRIVGPALQKVLQGSVLAAGADAERGTAPPTQGTT